MRVQVLRRALSGGTALAPSSLSTTVYVLFAHAVDLIHAAAMVLWGAGLPLLFWHHFRRLSQWYSAYAIVFVLISVVSHQLLGECFLTTLSRELWLSGGGYRDGTPFTAQLANFVAGIRPTDRAVVLAWEIAIVFTSLGSFWCWHRTTYRVHE
jgi:hypothetical protein